MRLGEVGDSRDGISSHSSFLTWLFPHCPHRDSRVHVPLPAQAHTCPRSTRTPGHTRSLTQHSFLIFALKISTSQGRELSDHCTHQTPPSKSCSQAGPSLFASRDGLKHKKGDGSNSSLLAQYFADLIPPTARSHSSLQLSP